jgi:hypothetical protein
MVMGCLVKIKDFFWRDRLEKFDRIGALTITRGNAKTWIFRGVTGVHVVAAHQVWAGRVAQKARRRSPEEERRRQATIKEAVRRRPHGRHQDLSAEGRTAGPTWAGTAGCRSRYRRTGYPCRAPGRTAGSCRAPGRRAWSCRAPGRTAWSCRVPGGKANTCSGTAARNNYGRGRQRSGPKRQSDWSSRCPLFVSEVVSRRLDRVDQQTNP